MVFDVVVMMMVMVIGEFGGKCFLAELYLTVCVMTTR